MLGLGDFWVSSVYILIILSALLCVVYGVVNWNKDGEDDQITLAEAKKWTEDEKEMEEKL